jgi:hypothetical protein
MVPTIPLMQTITHITSSHLPRTLIQSLASETSSTISGNWMQETISEYETESKEERRNKKMPQNEHEQQLLEPQPIVPVVCARRTSPLLRPSHKLECMSCVGGLMTNSVTSRYGIAATWFQYQDCTKCKGTYSSVGILSSACARRSVLVSVKVIYGKTLVSRVRISS